MKKLTLVGLVALAGWCRGEDSFLDYLDDHLKYQTPGGTFSTELNGLADFEGYTIDQNPPGLVFGTGDYLISPRLSLFLDTRLGEHLYSLVQVRFDRGFDPGSVPRGEAGLDEYFLRYTPWKEGWVNFQAGKFATVFGNWVARHDSWNNPFVNAPLPYENVLGVTDASVPPDAKAFLGRKLKVDQKTTWLPVLWGPSYAAGVSTFGTIQDFDYGLEFKNASLSSRPTTWDPVNYGWEDPTVSARFGWRPNGAWNLGVSGSRGGYLLPSAETGLPGGTGRRDYQQTTIGMDLGVGVGHLQVWSEVMASRFEIPSVGNADSVVYYVEAKYKFDPRWFAAVRWNQQFFGDVKNSNGAAETWDHDIWRMEYALAFRPSRHWQVKAQYSYGLQSGAIQQGEQLFAGQVTLKF